MELRVRKIMKRVYLNAASTVKPYPEVIKAVSKTAEKYWGNPSDSNSLADEARHLIEDVRQQFADDLNCSPEEIIFTSGGCEANSLAISGFLDANYGYELYSTPMEHSSVIEAAKILPDYMRHLKIKIEPTGIITPEALDKHIASHNVFSSASPLVSISGANSEIGVCQNIKELAAVTHKWHGAFHCDAVQLFPERRIDVKELGIDMMSISAQKFHSGRGVGVLYVRKDIKINSIIYGSQENFKRGGTYNTPAIVGMGVGLRLTREHNASEYVTNLRNQLLDKLLQIPGTHLNGTPVGAQRLANNISLTIDGVDAEQLMTLCDLSGVIIARGSACQAHTPTPSRALLAIGLTPEQALSTVRITLDEFNTEEEIIETAKIIAALVERIRSSES